MTTEPTDTQPQTHQPEPHRPVAEPAAAGELAAATVALVRLRPGDLPEPRLTIWEAQVAEHLRARLLSAQSEFVDDPVGAVDRARSVVAEAADVLTGTLTRVLTAAQSELDPHSTSSQPDTESLRVALRGYRQFLDRMLGL